VHSTTTRTVCRVISIVMAVSKHHLEAQAWYSITTISMTIFA
jgi:hypothetical protein